MTATQGGKSLLLEYIAGEVWRAVWWKRTGKGVKRIHLMVYGANFNPTLSGSLELHEAGEEGVYEATAQATTPSAWRHVTPEGEVYWLNPVVPANQAALAADCFAPA